MNLAEQINQAARELDHNKAWRLLLKEIERSLADQMLQASPDDMDRLRSLAYQKQALDTLRGEIQSRILDIKEKS